MTILRSFRFASRIAPALLSLSLAACGPGPELAAEGEEITETQQAIGSSCQYRVTLYQAEVASGQGVSEGDFETEFEGEVSGTYRNVPGQHVLNNSGGYRVVDTTPVKTVTVPDGQSLGFALWTSVTEVDNGGFNGTNDYGEQTGTITLGCPYTGPVYKVLTVTLRKNNGAGATNGSVRVKFKAER